MSAIGCTRDGLARRLGFTDDELAGLMRRGFVFDQPFYSDALLDHYVFRRPLLVSMLESGSPPERADPPPWPAPGKGGSAPAKALVRGVPPRKGAGPPFWTAPPPHPLQGGQGGAVEGTTTVYRHFDVGGVLLYVGISNDLWRRNDEHLRQKSWASEIATSAYEHLPTRVAALDRERELIKRLRPLYNVQHNR